jgi:hypothetical protein
LDESNWPKPGAGLGNGWTVADSTAKNLLDFTVLTESSSSEVTTIFPDGDTVRGTSSISTSKVKNQVNLIEVTKLTTNDQVTVSTQPVRDTATGFVQTFVSNYSRNTTEVDVQVSIQEIKPTLTATFQSSGQMGERVSINLVADVQPILTDPAGSDVLQLQDMRSVNLSEAIDSVVPMGDPARQSYIGQSRGDQSIQYLILLLRANLMKRARVVEITFAPPLERMPEITLRKNAYLVEPRIGNATGKIIGYSLGLDGSDGKIKCEVKIGCAIGHGGSHTSTAGTGHYASTNYVGGVYQQLSGQMNAIGTSVAYSPPNPVSNPNSINFLGTVTAADVIEVPLSVQYGAIPPAQQIPPIMVGSPDALKTATDFVDAYWIPQYETQATFKLKDVTGDITNEYTVTTSDLKIPTGYNLEA